jgi:hypothetical protein
MILGGIGLFVAALLLPASLELLIAVFAAMLVPLVIGTIYSLIYAGQARRV